MLGGRSVIWFAENHHTIGQIAPLPRRVENHLLFFWFSWLISIWMFVLSEWIHYIVIIVVGR
jgi:hypothetical protein